MVAPFPAPDEGKVDAAAEAEMGRLMRVVTAVRTIRATYEVDRKRRLDATLVAADPGDRAFFAKHEAMIRHLALLGGLNIVAGAGDAAGTIRQPVDAVELRIPMAGLFDVAAETARLSREVEKIEAELAVPRQEARQPAVRRARQARRRARGARAGGGAAGPPGEDRRHAAGAAGASREPRPALGRGDAQPGGPGSPGPRRPRRGRRQRATPPPRPPSIPPPRAVGTFVAKQDLVVAGLDVAMHVFQAVSSKVGWEARAREGDRFKAGDLIASVSGPARAHPHRRARGAELPAAHVGGGHHHPALRAGRGRHGGEDPRHAEDDAAAARAREAGGRGRRGSAAPLGPEHRDPRQGQPRPARGIGRRGHPAGGGGRGRPAGRGRGRRAGPDRGGPRPTARR